MHKEKNTADNTKYSFPYSIPLYVPYGSSRYGESEDVDLVRVQIAFFSNEIIDLIARVLQELCLCDGEGYKNKAAITNIITSVLRVYNVPATAFRKPTDEVVPVFPPPPREPFGVIVRACLNKDYPGVFSDGIIKDARDPHCLHQALKWHTGLRVNIAVRFPTCLTARKAVAAVVQYRAYAEWRFFVDTKSEYIEAARQLLPEAIAWRVQQLLWGKLVSQGEIDEVFEFVTGCCRDHRRGAVLFRAPGDKYIIRCGEEFWYSANGGAWRKIKDRRLHYFDIFDLREVGIFATVDKAMQHVGCCVFSGREEECLPLPATTLPL